MKKKANIIQNEKAPVPVDILAEAVVKMSAAIEKLNKGHLNSKAILVLLSHSCKLPQNQIKLVIDSIESLARDYTK